jgi:hypothetical protein
MIKISLQLTKLKQLFIRLSLIIFNGLMAFALILVVLPSTKSSAAPKKAETKKVPAEKKDAQAKLGTSFKFNGSNLHGKYQSSMGLSAAVENDKLLDDLLAGRKNFNDRIEQDQQRN